MQESGEMYLESILVLSNKLDSVRAINIVEFMNFSKPSVSRALSILKSDGFISVDDDGFITLTKSGREIAEKMYERHQMLTEVLTRLGVSRDVAEADACKIEHDISDETFKAIKKHLGK